MALITKMAALSGEPQSWSVWQREVKVQPSSFILLLWLKTLRPKATLRERELFDLQFQVSLSLREVRVRTKQETQAKTTEECGLQVATDSRLARSLIESRTTCPGNGVLHSGLGHPTPMNNYENSHGHDMPTGQSALGNSSTDIFLSDDPRLCQIED